MAPQLSTDRHQISSSQNSFREQRVAGAQKGTYLDAIKPANPGRVSPDPAMANPLCAYLAELKYLGIKAAPPDQPTFNCRKSDDELRIWG